MIITMYNHVIISLLQTDTKCFSLPIHSILTTDAQTT